MMKPCVRLFCCTMVLAAMLAVVAAACAQDSVTLETSEYCYTVGDTVSFTLTNNRDSTIYMPHSPVWSIWDVSADTLVYPSTVFWVIVPLGPDSSETYTWPQIDYHFNQVSQGNYSVEVGYSPQMVPWDPSYTVTDTFYVGGASALELGTWGGIKALYK
jgi:hypothetical protein